MTVFSFSHSAIAEESLSSESQVDSTQPATEQAEKNWLLQPLGEVAAFAVHASRSLSSPEELLDENRLIRLQRSSRLRSLCLDLIGLPPSPEKIRRFIADDRPDAWHRQVDRLISSPNFGERWARFWMDQARYGDSEGFDIDQPRPNAWRYRTWLIDAFNCDVPFDQMTTDQLASDLETDKSDRLVGLGFLRQSTRNTEAGADPEEDLLRQSWDRLETTADIWLGLQLKCARCHDHPYQEFSQTDHYRLLSLFRNLQDESIQAPTEAIRDEYTRKWPEAEQRLASLEATRKAYREKIAKRAFRSWLARTSFDTQSQWVPLKLDLAQSQTGEQLEILVDQSVLATGPLPDWAQYEFVGMSIARSITGLKIDCLPHPSLPLNGPGRHPSSGFSITRIRVWVLRASHPSAPEPVELLTAWTSDGAEPKQLTSLFSDRQHRQEQRLAWQVHSPAGNSASLGIEFLNTLHLQKGDRLKVTIDQSENDWMLTLGRLRLSVTESPAPLIDYELKNQPWTSSSSASETTSDSLFEYFLLRDTHDQQLSASIDSVRKQAPEDPTAVLADIIRESQQVRANHLYERGDFERPGVEVAPDLPVSLKRDLGGTVKTRADLSRWLFNEGRSIVARVVAARVHQRLTGEVVIRSDAGDSWTAPSVPVRQTIDSLAYEFWDSDWSLKQLIRSAILRQIEERSGKERRLEAEMLRDVLLVQSGLMHRQIGGRSQVMPQPLGRTEGAFSRAQPLPIAIGKELYVRGLYVWWQRTSPFPLFAQFGTPTSNRCETIRLTDVTAAQALSLLNEPHLYDLVRHVALDQWTQERQSEAIESHLLESLCLALWGRAPAPEEAAYLNLTHRELGEFYRVNPALVEQILNGLLWIPQSRDDQADLCAWIMVARIMVNSPDFVSH